MHFRTGHIVLVISSLFCTVQLFAVQHSRADKNIEEVAVVANRSATSTQDLSGSISIISTEELNRISATHIQEALRTVPGVNFQRGSGQESLPSIRSAVLTGAGACGSNLILEDGIPVRGTGFCNVNELFDTHFEQAAQIEILRGPQSAFYGSNGLTGSINVSLPVSGRDRVSLEVGPDNYVRTKIAAGYGDEDSQHIGRAYLTLTEDGGFRQQSGYGQQKLSLRHQYTNDNFLLSAGLTATNLNQETAGFIVGLDSYRDESLVEQNLDPEAFRDTQSLRAWTSFKWALNDNDSFEFKPYIRITDMDFRLHFLPGEPLEQNSQKGLGWQSAFTSRTNQSLSWTLGFDGEFAQGELSQTQDTPTQGSAFLQATIPTGTHYDYKVDSSQLGFFGHTSWEATDKLRATLGARWEYINYDYDNLSLDGRTRDDGTECGFGGCRYSRPADREDSFNHFSPKLELRYAFNEAWQAYTLLADSFRAPQATELYRLQRAQTVADLDTVEATTFELGFNWQGSNSQANVSVYQIEQRNLIIRDSDFFNVDNAATDSIGVELDLGYTFNKAWSLRTALAYAKHEYAADQISGGENINGNTVDTAPRLYGSLFALWQPTAKLSSEIEVVHVDEYFIDVNNTRKYPGHTLVHWRTHYAFNDQWDISFRVNNVTDRLYAKRADFTTFTNERYFPGTPRSLFVEIRREF